MSTEPTPFNEARGYRVLEIQPTPNPNAMKFVLDRAVCEVPISFLTPAAGREHPLARALFAVHGVSSLLMLGDFITVNKLPTVSWKEVSAQVKKILESA